MGRLLEGDTYSGIKIHGAALIRDRRLFETWRLLEEIR